MVILRAVTLGLLLAGAPFIRPGLMSRRSSTARPSTRGSRSYETRKARTSTAGVPCWHWVSSARKRKRSFPIFKSSFETNVFSVRPRNRSRRLTRVLKCESRG